jgi:hypothetical protein
MVSLNFLPKTSNVKEPYQFALHSCRLIWGMWLPWGHTNVVQNYRRNLRPPPSSLQMGSACYYVGAPLLGVATTDILHYDKSTKDSIDI